MEIQGFKIKDHYSSINPGICMVTMLHGISHVPESQPNDFSVNQEYRRKVYSAMTKYHGTEGSERKPRKRPSDGAQSARRKPTIKKDTDTNISVNKSGTKVLKQNQLKKSKSPAYKDPLVSSKLEMIKSIRAQRADAETKQANAIEQARLLIAEAEKAAKALEVAATKSPIAQASLIETRKLIAEAIQSLESIDAQGMITVRNVPSVEVLNQSLMVPLNGHKALPSSDSMFSNDVNEFSLQKVVNRGSELHLTRSNGNASVHVGFNSKIDEPSSSYQQKETEHDHSTSSEYKRDPSPTVLGTGYIEDETQLRDLLRCCCWSIPMVLLLWWKFSCATRCMSA